MPEIIVSVTTTGSAGSATGTADTPPIYGFVEEVQVNYHASAPATTDIDIDEVGGLARSLYTKDDSATDVSKRPRLRCQNTAGTDVDAYEQMRLEGRPLRVSLAGCDALTGAVVVTFVIDGKVGLA